MFRFRFSPLAALAGLLIVFTSCERHHLGEMPELQKEHLHPLAPKGEEVDPGGADAARFVHARGLFSRRQQP